MDYSTISIDKIIHEKARLIILTYLANTTSKNVAFNELKEKLEFTSGNLSVQLRTLENTGYIKINKKIKNKKSSTTVVLTPEGLKALNEYIGQMESIINMVKKNTRDERGNPYD